MSTSNLAAGTKAKRQLPYCLLVEMKQAHSTTKDKLTNMVQCVCVCACVCVCIRVGG